ncbi:MAG: hypothetical protein CL938_00265 [Deltaproteobacteria bacterium]|nr:hypothetical protein [Deltaproteobacteria bacterium]
MREGRALGGRRGAGGLALAGPRPTSYRLARRRAVERPAVLRRAGFLRAVFRFAVLRRTGFLRVVFRRAAVRRRVVVLRFAVVRLRDRFIFTLQTLPFLSMK